MASVHKRSHRGRIQYRALWRESGAGGKPRLRSKSFTRSADAKAYAAKMAAEVERRGVGDPEKQTTAQYLKSWVDRLEARGEHSPTTIDVFSAYVRMVTPLIGEILLAKLSANDLDAAYGELLQRGGRWGRPLKARTVSNIHRTLRTALQRAFKPLRLIPENPAADVKPPALSKRQVRHFEAKERAPLLAAAKAEDPETYCMAAVLLTCGLRRGELAGLALDAIDLEAGELTVKRVVVEDKNGKLHVRGPKTDSSIRTMKIPPELVDLIRGQIVRIKESTLRWGAEYQRKPMFLFPGAAGTPRVPAVITRRMKKLLAIVGVTGAQPCHGWRHTAATVMLHAGHNIKTVQTRLGHATPAITMALYVHPDEEQDAAAAAHLGELLDRE